MAKTPIRGSWIDGYLSSREELKQLAQLYRDLDGAEYGFSRATDVWTREDYFGSIAAALRDRHERDKPPTEELHTPASMWLFQVAHEPSDPRVKPIFDEYANDPRREDYYHLVALHDESPAEEQGLQEVLSALHFGVKPASAYTNPSRFGDAVRYLLAQYVDLMPPSWLEIQRRLVNLGDNVTPLNP